MIDDPQNLDIASIKLKALTLSWEVMFARSMFQIEDMDVQHKLLDRVSELLDNKTLITPANHHGGDLSVPNLLGAHERQESSSTLCRT